MAIVLKEEPTGEELALNPGGKKRRVVYVSDGMEFLVWNLPRVVRERYQFGIRIRVVLIVNNGQVLLAIEDKETPILLEDFLEGVTPLDARSIQISMVPQMRETA